MTLTVERVEGAAIEPFLADLAALRMEVFREFPYLYEGTLDYESHYLRGYADSQRSLVVIARDDATVVGASTAMPLVEHGEGLAPVMERAGLDPAQIYYFGESILRGAYRGQRIGHAFFDAREARARELGFPLAAFCAVVRAESDARRPPHYVPHDAFWHKRGYAKRDDVRAEFSWRDLGDTDESPKPMVFWFKELQT